MTSGPFVTFGAWVGDPDDPRAAVPEPFPAASEWMPEDIASFQAAWEAATIDPAVRRSVARLVPGVGVPPPHLRVPSALTATCSCGWSGQGRADEQWADADWYGHVVEAETAQLTDQERRRHGVASGSEDPS